MSKIVEFKVGMTCGGCSGAITRILKKIEGVDTIDADVETKVSVYVILVDKTQQDRDSKLVLELSTLMRSIDMLLSSKFLSSTHTNLTI